MSAHFPLPDNTEHFLTLGKTYYIHVHEPSYHCILKGKSIQYSLHSLKGNAFAFTYNIKQRNKLPHVLQFQ